MKTIILTFYLLLFSQAILAQNLTIQDQVRIKEAYLLKQKYSEKIWKNWNNNQFVLLLVTPNHEFLINHSNPSKDFVNIGYNKTLDSNVLWRKRVFSQGLMAAFPAVNGVSTIVAGQAENTTLKTSTPWVVSLLHEHFHQFQTSQTNYYDEVNELDLANGDTSGMWMLNYAFPYSNEKIKTKFDELSKMLAQLLEYRGKKLPEKMLNQYLTTRKDFQNLLKLKDYRYFSLQIWQEGVARYTEYEVANFAAKNYQASKEFKNLQDWTSFKQVADDLYKQIIQDLKNPKLEETKRIAFYSFGAGEAILLNKVNPKWKDRYNSERFYLEKYFEKQK